MSILETSELTKHFLGISALNRLDMAVQQGQIHGLIGPNGSGKTTFFNVVSGVLPATEGNVFLDGADITSLPSHAIVKLGIGRTFQKAKLMPMMSCAENVMAGLYCRTKVDVLGTFLRLPLTTSAQEKRMRRRAVELLEFVGLAESSERRGADLVWVECQLLQIARALASEPKVLLLDEPTSGMGPEESERVAQLIRSVRDNLGVTVVLVAHDAELLMGISDWVTVINFGEKIGEGTPSQVRNDPKVLEAYLGEE